WRARVRTTAPPHWTPACAGVTQDARPRRIRHSGPGRNPVAHLRDNRHYATRLILPIVLPGLAPPGNDDREDRAPASAPREPELAGVDGEGGDLGALLLLVPRRAAQESMRVLLGEPARLHEDARGLLDDLAVVELALEALHLLLHGGELIE